MHSNSINRDAFMTSGLFRCRIEKTSHKKMVTLSVIAASLTCILLIQKISAQQTGSYTITPDFTQSSYTRVQITITGSSLIKRICAVDTVAVGATYDKNSVLETKNDCCQDASGTTVELDFVITNFLTIILPSTAPFPTLQLSDCGIETVDLNTGSFKLSVRSFGDLSRDSETDHLFVLPFTIFSGSTGTIPYSAVLADPVSNSRQDLSVFYSAQLEFVDASFNSKSNWALGDQACLQATLLVDPFQDGLDYAGMRLHTCYFTGDGNTTDETPFIGENGCSDDRYDPLISSDAGYLKAGVVVDNTQRIYIARFPCFELFTINNEGLSVSCSVDYCTDDTDFISSGSCGGRHCNPSQRRKRDVSENSSTLSTSIKVRQPAQPKVLPCSSSLTFRVTVGSLGTLSIGLAIMILSCGLDLYRHRQNRKRKNGTSMPRTEKMAVVPVKCPDIKEWTIY